MDAGAEAQQPQEPWLPDGGKDCSRQHAQRRTEGDVQRSEAREQHGTNVFQYLYRSAIKYDDGLAASSASAVTVTLYAMLCGLSLCVSFYDM